MHRRAKTYENSHIKNVYIHHESSSQSYAEDMPTACISSRPAP